MRVTINSGFSKHGLRFLVGGLFLSLLPMTVLACDRRVNVEHFGQRVDRAKSDSEAGWLHYVKFRQIVQKHTGADYTNDVDAFVSLFETDKNSDVVTLALTSLTNSADCGGKDAIALMDQLGDLEIIALVGVTDNQVQSAIDDYFYKSLRQQMILTFGRQIVSVAMQRLGPRTQFATVSMRYILSEKPNCTINETGDRATCEISARLDMKDEYNSSVSGIHGDLAGALRSLGNMQEFRGVINLAKTDGKWSVLGNPLSFR